MHERDRDLMTQIQKFFGGIGYISNPNKNTTVEFRVSTMNDLVNVIIPHFDKYPLITPKFADYLLFKQAFNLISLKEHLTTDGLYKLVAIKSKSPSQLLIPLLRLSGGDSKAGRGSE